VSTSNPSLLLHEYRPNHSAGRLFRYDGQRVEEDRSIALSSQRAFNGYLVPYWESLATKRSVIIFGREGKLYIDISGGAHELLPVHAAIRNRIFGRTIEIHTSAGPRKLKVFTPFWRYLTNDGMFPEDVEPLVHLMRELTDASSRLRFVFRFENGKWPEA
jgi:hypothetical protein